MNSVLLAITGYFRRPQFDRGRIRAGRRQGRCQRPWLEALEDRLAPATLTTLASFTSSTGTGPDGGMVMDSQGNLFGTTVQGGTFNYGTVSS
jgi:hypothetical protein